MFLRRVSHRSLSVLSRCLLRGKETFGVESGMPCSSNGGVKVDPEVGALRAQKTSLRGSVFWALGRRTDPASPQKGPIGKGLTKNTAAR